MLSSKKQGRTDYRPDIDGLRAVAVLAVIFFHINRAFAPGGFVGVDIFFVISGYLITSQIQSDLQAGKFSIKVFYLRRIRRISPALFLMLFVVLVAAYLIQLPEQICSFANSLIVQPVSLQNIVFLSEGEYFREAAAKPLLHTWSLAVEEQFYLFWPVILLLLGKLRVRTSAALFVLLAALSFGLNILLIGYSPKSSFFLFPTRAWELMIGAAAAIFTYREWKNTSTGQRLCSTLQTAGLILIAISITTINSEMPFPGMVAMLPAIGTYLVVALATQEKTFVTRALSNDALVKTGLISYPLYLWHWPILAFLNLKNIPLDGVIKITVFLISTFVLAIFSYRFVETPIRRKKWLATSRQLVTAAIMAALVVVSVSAHILLTDGAAYRYSAPARPFLTAGFHSQSDRCGFVFRVLHPGAAICELTESTQSAKKVLLWGNSHADMWSGAMRKTASENAASLFLNMRNCMPTPSTAFCNADVQNMVLEAIKQQSITDVVLASTWYGSYDVEDHKFEGDLRDLVSRLAGMGINVWLVVDPPSGAELSPMNAYEKNEATPHTGEVSLQDYDDKRRQRELKLFESIRGIQHGVNVIDATDVFCSEGRCFGGRQSEIWYRDLGHLSDAGAKVAMGKFLPVFLVH